MFNLFSETNNSFEGQRPDEVVHLLTRQHWFMIIPTLVGFLLLLLIPFFAYSYIQPFLVRYEIESIFWFIISLYLLIWWIGLFYRVTMFLLNVWIVTDERIISNRQAGLWRHQVAEMSLERVQDISLSITSPIATWLDFGQIEIQTAGAAEKFFFENVPHPAQIKDEIMGLARPVK